MGKKDLTPEEEFNRYIEHLQSSMASDEFETVTHSSYLSWLKLHRDRLIGSFGANPNKVTLADEFIAKFESFHPKTRYELWATHGIFQPQLKTIANTARKISLAPKRPVRLATSPSVEISPYARSSGEHLMFIGLGTSLFCNYWAKIFSEILIAIGKSGNDMTSPGVRSALSNLPHQILSASKLALFYASRGSVVGFGELPQDQRSLPARIEILNAMEYFIVAHEYSHFIYEERIPSEDSRLGSTISIEREYECDQMGMMLCRNSIDNNRPLFCGAGPILLFSALALCDQARELLQERSKSITKPDENFLEQRLTTHPSHIAPIDMISQYLNQTTAPDQQAWLAQNVTEYRTLGEEVGRSVLEILNKQIR